MAKTSTTPFITGLRTENLIEAERKVLGFWDSAGIFAKRRDQNKAGPLFRFLDGPITANNPMGIHHAWGRTLKDVVLRYQALRGKQCHYQPGFDCQGLWVEIQVEKELGISTKEDIERFGLQEFSNACKARVGKYSGIQAQQSRRLGMWLDFNDAYYTHSDANIEGIWKFLGVCQSNGWLYRDHRVMPWSPRTQTSLSEHEMAGSYKDLTHRTSTVKVFAPSLGASLLVWTTTPWTLSANTAIAVNPEHQYAFAEVPGESHPLIVGKDLLKSVLKRSHRVLKIVSGTELIGHEYEPILNDLSVQVGARKIVGWKEASATDGTGLVHIAPGCGPQDFELGKAISLPIISPLDETGNFLPNFDYLSGLSFSAAVPVVMDRLKALGKLFEEGEITHSCAVCWRSGVEVVYRMVDEWFISCKEIRPRMLAAVDRVSWHPAHIKKRMQNWLENMGDWCISRKRYWGLPLPIYEGKGEVVFISSRQQLRDLAVDPKLVDDLPELHRPWIDRIQIRSPKTGNILTRISEVGDCWLDAGITPFTTKGLYEDPVTKTGWDRADYVVEMSEQTRLWFYSMLFMAVTLRDQAPYKSVWTHERVTNEDGTKFSKTGKMIEFNEAAETIGADVVRYLFAKQRPMSDVRFGYSLADDVRQKICGFLNAVEFFKTYADVDQPNLAELTPGKSPNVLDQWLAARRVDFISQFGACCEKGEFSEALGHFERFSDDLSNFYIRASRRRFWKGELDDDKKSAYAELFATIRDVSTVMSPFIPFTTEAVWQDVIVRSGHTVRESVHLTHYPSATVTETDRELLAQAEIAREIASLALSSRAQSQIKARQPLRLLEVSMIESQWNAIAPFLDIIRNEVNVKDITRVSDTAQWSTAAAEINFGKAGPIFRDKIGLFKALFTGLDATQRAEITQQLVAGQPSVAVAGWEHGPILAQAFSLTSSTKPHLVTAKSQKGDIACALDTTIDLSLRNEGIARDLLRNIQNLRKESGLHITDRIELLLTSNDEDVRAAVTSHRAHIESETLAVMVSSIDSPIGEQIVDLGDLSAVIKIARRC